MIQRRPLLEFEIPVKTKSLNAREHWAPKAVRVAKERKATAEAFNAYAMLARLNRIVGGKWRELDEDKYRIELTRISPGTLDFDNLVGALKGVRDEVALQLGFENDNDPRLDFDYKQDKCKRGVYGVRVKIDGVV